MRNAQPNLEIKKEQKNNKDFNHKYHDNALFCSNIEKYTLKIEWKYLIVYFQIACERKISIENVWIKLSHYYFFIACYYHRNLKEKKIELF